MTQKTLSFHMTYPLLTKLVQTRHRHNSKNSIFSSIGEHCDGLPTIKDSL